MGFGQHFALVQIKRPQLAGGQGEVINVADGHAHPAGFAVILLEGDRPQRGTGVHRDRRCRGFTHDDDLVLEDPCDVEVVFFLPGPEFLSGKQIEADQRGIFGRRVNHAVSRNDRSGRPPDAVQGRLRHEVAVVVIKAVLLLGGIGFAVAVGPEDRMI